MARRRQIYVDGTDAISGDFLGDGELPPFVVFDADAQCNIAGPFLTRDEAETHRLEILAGVEPRLDERALSEWIERIDKKH